VESGPDEEPGYKNMKEREKKNHVLVHINPTAKQMHHAIFVKGHG
jgi:hypothetical protein